MATASFNCGAASPRVIPWMFAVRLITLCPLFLSINPGMVPDFMTAISLEVRFAPAILHHGDFAEFFHSLHPVLRQLHLDLECISGVWVPPVIRLREARRRSGWDHRANHVRHGQSELTRTLAVDVDIERRIIDRLSKLKIPKEGNLGHLRLNLLSESIIVLQIATQYCDFNGRGRPEAHHLAHDVSGLEGDLSARQFLLQAAAQSLPQRFSSGQPGAMAI